MAEQATPTDSPVDWVNDHIKQYIESEGAEGYDWRGTEILLLTTIGRRSGTPRRTALIHRVIDGNYVIVASKGGAEKHPLWYLNLEANPEVTVRVKDKEFPAHARTAQGEERAPLGQARRGLACLQRVPDQDRPRDPRGRPRTPLSGFTGP